MVLPPPPSLSVCVRDSLLSVCLVCVPCVDEYRVGAEPRPGPAEWLCDWHPLQVPVLGEVWRLEETEKILLQA